jgi:hypothetical protein
VGDNTGIDIISSWANAPEDGNILGCINAKLYT